MDGVVDSFLHGMVGVVGMLRWLVYCPYLQEQDASKRDCWLLCGTYCVCSYMVCALMYRFTRKMQRDRLVDTLSQRSTLPLICARFSFMGGIGLRQQRQALVSSTMVLQLFV